MRKNEERYSVEFENQGQKIFGVVHRPLTEMPCPAVIMCHGLAGHKIGKNKLYVLLSEKLAELGIASLRFDFRGSGDSEGDFIDMTISGEVSDAVEALDYLVQASGIDSSSLGIFGRSLGGIIAILAAEQTLAFKGIAIWASAFHAQEWHKMWEDKQKELEHLKEKPKAFRYNGTLINEVFLEEFFTLNLEDHLKRIDHLPLLHMHGEMDEVVHISHVDCFEKIRQSAKAETKVIRLPNSDHDFTHPEEQLFAINETAQWFKSILNKGSESV